MKPNYDWFIQNWKDSAHVQLLSATELQAFSAKVQCRAEEVGRDDFHTLIGHCLYRALYEQHLWGSMGGILEDIIAPPTPGPLLPLFNGAVRVNSSGTRGALEDDSGPLAMAGLSAFWVPWAVRDNPDYLDRAARWAVKCGFRYLRWFGMHDWEGGVQIRPGHLAEYEDLMDRSIKAVASYGLLSEITMFTRRSIVYGSPGDVADIFGDVVSANRESVVLVECCNESAHSHNAFPVQDVHDVAMRFLQSCGDDTPLALSAPLSTTWEDVEQHALDLYSGLLGNTDAVTIHYPRKDNTFEGPWRWVRQPWHSTPDNWSGGAINGTFNGKIVVDNEHQRWDKSNGGRDVGVAVAGIVNAFICGCAMSCHHDVYGVVNNAGEYADDPVASRLQTVLQTVLPLIPQNITHYRAVRVGRTDLHPFPGLIEQQWSDPENESDQGVSRCYAAVRGEKFVMALNGVKKQVTLDAPGLHYKVVSLSSGETVYEGSGDTVVHQHDGNAFLVVSS